MKHLYRMYFKGKPIPNGQVLSGLMTYNYAKFVTPRLIKPESRKFFKLHKTDEVLRK